MPDWLNDPTGPLVSVVTFFVEPSESLKVPDVIAVPLIEADPADPALFDLKGPLTLPPEPLDPPPPPNENIEHEVDPDNVIVHPLPPDPLS